MKVCDFGFSMQIFFAIDSIQNLCNGYYVSERLFITSFT